MLHIIITLQNTYFLPPSCTSRQLPTVLLLIKYLRDCPQLLILCFPPRLNMLYLSELGNSGTTSQVASFSNSQSSPPFITMPTPPSFAIHPRPHLSSRSAPLPACPPARFIVPVTHVRNHCLRHSHRPLVSSQLPPCRSPPCRSSCHLPVGSARTSYNYPHTSSLRVATLHNFQTYRLHRCLFSPFCCTALEPVYSPLTHHCLCAFCLYVSCPTAIIHRIVSINTQPTPARPFCPSLNHTYIPFRSQRYSTVPCK